MSKRLFIAVAPYAWGKGASEAEAVENCRANIPWKLFKPRADLELNSFATHAPEFEILDGGTLRVPDGHHISKVGRYVVTRKSLQVRPEGWA